MNHLLAGRLNLLVIFLLLAAMAIAPIAFAQNVSLKPAPGSPIGVGSAPTSVATSDFNGDGILDLAVANANDNTVSVFLGKGDGTFSSSGTFTVNRNPFPTLCVTGCSSVPIAIAVGDFNNDGKLDLAVTNIPINDGYKFSALFGNICSSVAILLGKGDGTFQDSNQFDSGGHLPTSVAVANFNNDVDKNGVAKLDLAIVNLNSGNVEILLGDGGGNFSSKTSIPVGTNPTSVATGDFNGDGIADLVVTNTNDSTISVLLGKGDGTFGAATNFSVGVRPISVAVGDLNGDGKPDLVVANLLSSTVSVFLGDGTGSFGAPTSYPVGRYPSSIALADFNRDGKTDIAVANRFSDVVSVLLGNGDGTFATAKHFSTGNKPLSIAAGDFNGDHATDVAVVNIVDNTVSILLNNTDSTPPVTTASASPPPNSNGWNDTSVAVTLSSTDSEPNGSGVKEIHYTIGSNPQVVVPGASALVNFTTEGIFTLSYFGVDNAGNVESAHTLTVQIDLTPPTITSSQSPPANAAGWNNSNVAVTFTCGDNLSGVASCIGTASGAPSGDPITITSEGAGQVVTGTAIDNAGNTATTTRTINLDKTPPVLTMPVLAASYLLNSTLTLNFGATDALSGVATMQATLNGAPIVSGTTVTLTHLATNTFTLTATDVAGNSSTQTATFAVVYNFIGFLPPIQNDGTGLFKLGSTVPVKFQLTDAHGTLVSTAVAHLTIQMISGSTLVGTPIDATASGNSDVGDLFRFDGTQYIFNWSTKPVSTGTWQLQARLDDGTVHTVVMGTK
jgi:hypothetical protein